jgi:DNA-binding NarL/FixJ family response regulator
MDELLPRRNQERIRVLLADDHPLVRAGIRSVLTAEEDIALVGEAVDGDQVQRLCQELEPDILLLDLNMPGPSPFETVAYLRQHCPRVKVLVLTAYDDDAYVRGLTAAGVAGYLLKDEVPETVVRAIRVAVQGKSWFSQPVVEKLVRLKTEEAILTDRERQILSLIAQGRNNSQIAIELDLAEQTVRNYVSRIYVKLNLDSRVQAVVWARERGWV